MNRTIFSFLLLLLSILLCHTAHATNWHVDNSIAASGDGKSWSTAWKTFSHINWALINPGDTIFISGGSTSKTYTERLKPQAGGSFTGGFITIQTGQESGHNGTVIIHSDLYQGLVINNYNYIKISGQVGQSTDCKLRITGAPMHGIDLLGTADHILLEYLQIDNNGLSSGIAGIHAAFSNQPADIEIGYCKIHDNYNDAITFAGATIASGFDLIRIHHCDIFNVHDDGIECWPGGLSFYNNKLHDRITPHRGHPDGMQIYNPKYIRIYNNDFEWYNSADSGAGALPAIYMPCNGSLIGGGPGNYDPHHVYIYNNVFYEDTEFASGTYPVIAISLGLSDSTILEISNILIANNYFQGDYATTIIIGWSGTTIDKENVYDFEIVNNIFNSASYSEDSPAMQISIPSNVAGNDVAWGSYGDGGSVVFDHNVYYGVGSRYVDYLSDLTSYGDFVMNSGCQKRGVISNPSLDASFKADSADDPVVGAGRDLSHLFDYDKDGNTRPPNSWDIGPFQSLYTASNGEMLPAAPQNLTVAQ
jgi:hypothetical protein